MRVLFHLIGSEVGGGQQVAADIATGLRARGHGIGVLVPDRGPALARFEEAGACIHVVDLGSLRTPWHIAAAARVVRDYDLLYSHTSTQGEILGSAAARLARRPQLVHRHSYLDFARNPHRRRVQRALYRAAVGGRPVIAVAEHIRRELGEVGVVDVVTIPNGTELRDEPLRSDSGELQIGVLGRFDAQKGIDIFIEAAHRAKLSRAASWTAAGPPGPDPAYVTELQRLAAAAGVALRGRVAADDFLGELDIVVVPSRYEGLPLVVLESLALGRAVVGSDIPGIRAVLGDGAGVLVPPNDAAALAAAIEALAADDALRRELGARGRELVHDRYDVRRTVERTVEVVERAGLSRGRSERRA